MLKRMLIERGAMGQKKEVKLEDIADSLGVSIVTVSNALKGKNFGAIWMLQSIRVSSLVLFS